MPVHRRHARRGRAGGRIARAARIAAADRHCRRRSDRQRRRGGDVLALCRRTSCAEGRHRPAAARTGRASIRYHRGAGRNSAAAPVRRTAGMAAHLAAARVMPTNKTAVYLYCVVRSARRPSLAGASSGVPSGTPPAAHKVTGNLWMIVADVPLDVYGPASLESRLRDLDWVAAVAIAHEALVERFTRARGSVVVPAKLFTMFGTLEKALDDVTGRRTEIQRVMKRIEGCEEWGIRITRHAVMPAAADAPAASGAAFLLARKAARDAVVTARTQAS